MHDSKIESVRTTANRRSSIKLHSYAFISVSSEDDGNKFITNVSETTLDGLKLKAEWSSSSDPMMPKQPHTIERDGVPGVARWHPKVGPLTDMVGWQGPADQPSPQAQDQDPTGEGGRPALDIYSTPQRVGLGPEEARESQQTCAQKTPQQEVGPATACSSHQKKT